MGQTEFDVLNLEDQETLREEILTLLGLTHSPAAGEGGAHRVDMAAIGNHTVRIS